MIDYMKLAVSVNFYEKAGFVRMEAPWWVSKQILDVTTPPHIKECYYLPNNKKCLVASGEQAFLYMAAKGRLPKGKFQTVTPCFRDESIGILSKKCFMKNELIITDDVSESSLQAVIAVAHDFFKTMVPDEKLLTVAKTDEGYDIQYDGIEVGSYGIRSCEFLDWVYATGCAEPRLSRAIRISEKKRRNSMHKKELNLNSVQELANLYAELGRVGVPHETIMRSLGNICPAVQEALITRLKTLYMRNQQGFLVDVGSQY